MKITAKSPEDGTSLSVEYPIPESLEALADKFGDGVVYDLAVNRLVVNVQNVMRVGLKSGKDHAVIQDEALSYIPGARAKRETKSPFERMLASIQGGTITPEQLAVLQAALKGAGAKKAA